MRNLGDRIGDRLKDKLNGAVSRKIERMEESAYKAIVDKFSKRHSPLDDARARFLKAHQLGYQLKCKYTINLSLYDRGGALRNALANAGSMLAVDGSDGEMPPEMTLRATDVRWPLASMDSDTVKAGSMTTNRITGSQSPEIEVTFLEGSEADFARTFQVISDFTLGVGKNGATGLMRSPAEYALWLTISLGQLPMSSKNRADRIVQSWSYLVALQNINLDMAARDTNTLMEIPATFVRLDPYME